MKTPRSWLGSVSDMMAGLMMVFLLISLAFMVEMKHQADLANDANKKVREITAAYKKTQVELYEDLLAIFEGDLKRWDATLERDSTVRFNEPDVLFEPGEAAIRPRFRDILADFFPRYVEVLTRPKYAGEIDEVRIEGHTSTDWQGVAELKDRYLNNARLSQERAFAVLDYVFRLEKVSPRREWLIATLRANGLSFARPIKVGIAEDVEQSRRVEFRAVTKTREKVLKVIELIEPAHGGAE